jgi:hypothetical protein
MKLFKPSTWFKKPEPESNDFVWAKVNPIRPHISISFLSDAPSACGFKIKGISLDQADSIPLLGRVIDWDRFTAKEQEAIKSGTLEIGFRKLMSIVRK